MNSFCSHKIFMISFPIVLFTFWSNCFDILESCHCIFHENIINFASFSIYFITFDRVLLFFSLSTALCKNARDISCPTTAGTFKVYEFSENLVEKELVAALEEVLLLFLFMNSTKINKIIYNPQLCRKLCCFGATRSQDSGQLSWHLFNGALWSCASSVEKKFSGVTLSSVPGPHAVCFSVKGEIMSRYQKIFTPLLCMQPLVAYVVTSM